jgi:hypothetical protein
MFADESKGKSPLVFEAILFFIIKSDYWDLNDVATAHQNLFKNLTNRKLIARSSKL